MNDQIPGVKEDTEETEEIQSEEHQMKVARMQIEEAIRAGASWFYIIAALSLINSIIVLFLKSNWSFIVGLGVMMLIDAIMSEVGGAGNLVALILDIIIAGIFVLFGVFASKKHLWAFLAGLILYILDLLLIVLLLIFSADPQLLFYIIFHGVVGFFIIKGIKALRVYEKIEQKGYADR